MSISLVIILLARINYPKKCMLFKIFRKKNSSFLAKTEKKMKLSIMLYPWKSDKIWKFICQNPSIEYNFYINKYNTLIEKSYCIEKNTFL